MLDEEMTMEELAAELEKGERILCPLCEKGILEPSNKDVPAKSNHVFVCSNCGERMNRDPIVEIK